MTTSAATHTTGTGPFAALQAQARRAPQAEALRARRRGQWRAWSWQRLAAHAEQAARGWASLGVVPGNRIVALGPLGPELIVTLFAADAVGATVVLVHDEGMAAAAGDARFAFADGTHDLERLLQHRGPQLQAAVVGDAAAVPPAGQIDRLPVVSSARLRADGRAAVPRAPELTSFPTALLVDRDGIEHVLVHAVDASLALGPADRVFADFPPTWLPGLEFLLQDWPRNASLLLIPEPDGDTATDRRDAAANVWLAPRPRLAEVSAELLARMPAHGVGASLARAVLHGRPSWLGGIVRSRIRAGIGLAAARHTVSDAGPTDAASTLFAALGVAPLQRVAVPAALAARGAAAEATPDPSFERNLVAAP